MQKAFGSGSPECEAAHEAQGIPCDEEFDAEGRIVDFEVSTSDGLLEKARALGWSLDWSCSQEDAAPALVRDILAVMGGPA